METLEELSEEYDRIKAKLDAEERAHNLKMQGSSRIFMPGTPGILGVSTPNGNGEVSTDGISMPIILAPGAPVGDIPASAPGIGTSVPKDR